MRIEVDVDLSELDPTDIVEDVGVDVLLDEMSLTSVIKYLVKHNDLHEILDAIGDPDGIREWLEPEIPDID